MEGEDLSVTLGKMTGVVVSTKVLAACRSLCDSSREVTRLWLEHQRVRSNKFKLPGMDEGRLKQTTRKRERIADLVMGEQRKRNL